MPGNERDIYAPGGLGQELATTLAGQMQYTYFPVALDPLGATIRYHDLGEGTFEIGPARVTAQCLNHPALTLGYHLDVGGSTLVYATPRSRCSFRHALPRRSTARATKRLSVGALLTGSVQGRATVGPGARLLESRRRS